MKRIMTVALPGGMLFLVFAVWALASSADTVFKQLNISEENARSQIRTSLMGHGLHLYGAGFKSVAAGERAGVVRSLGQYAKEYTRTEEFRQAYQRYREEHKPAPPAPAGNAASMKAEQRAQLTKAIAEAEANMQTMPAEVQATMKEMVASFRQQLQELDDPNNPMFSKDMDAMLQQGAAADQQSYRERLAQWEQKYPPTPDTMIRGWLEEFLKETQGVDFAAKLAPAGGNRMKFENPAFEAKPANWKMCYRAGREATEAAWAFAREWLSQLSR